MSTEAFLWSYRDGDAAPLPYDAVRRIFATYIDDSASSPERWRVWFGNSDGVRDTCDIDVATGLTIWNPIGHREFWRCVLELMHLGHVMLFFSDKTTPMFVSEESVAHFPAELLAELGTPLIIGTADDIVRSFDL